MLAAIAFLLVLAAPWGFAFGSTPLGPCPLRKRLERTARRLRVRCGQIRIIEGPWVSAIVTGILPWPRFVILSGRLIDEMPPEEVEAIFRHEAAHLKLWHMPLMLAYIVLGAFAVAAAWEASLVFGLAVLAALVGGFGPLSRLLERQADAYAARTGPKFREALRRIAEMNGEPLDRSDWRHGSVAERLQALEGRP